MRMISRRLLEMHGYEVLEAASGPEALALWGIHQADVALLLTDVVMPEGLSGGELAQKLQAAKSDLKTIFMSGYSPGLIEKDSEFFRRVNAEFLQKPCSSSLLLETVRRVLDER